MKAITSTFFENISRQEKYFYERSKFSEFESNTTYHNLLSMSDSEFTEWARLLRKEVTQQWDDRGTPPVIGKDESGIIESLSKLKSNTCDFLADDFFGDFFLEDDFFGDDFLEDDFFGDFFFD